MTESNPLVRLAVAVGAIVAIALAAATVRSPLEIGSDGTGSDGVSGTGPGDDGGAGQPPPPEPGDGGIPPFLEVLIAIVIVLLALALVWYLVAHRREAVKLIAVGLVAVVVLGVLAFVLLKLATFLGGAVEMPAGLPGVDEGGGSSGGGDSSGDGEDSPISPGPLSAVLALVTAVFLGGLFLSRGSDDSGAIGNGSTDAAESSEPAETAAAVGTAAGEAADRLEDAADFDNAVYRAWREMTRPLEVDRPESSTPREFARAATDAGMDRERVDELTQLFEDVRYGDASTTADREARAIEVLRRIETEYADSTGQRLRDESLAAPAPDGERRRGDDG